MPKLQASGSRGGAVESQTDTEGTANNGAQSLERGNSGGTASENVRGESPNREDSAVQGNVRQFRSPEEVVTPQKSHLMPSTGQTGLNRRHALWGRDGCELGKITHILRVKQLPDPLMALRKMPLDRKLQQFVGGYSEQPSRRLWNWIAVCDGDLICELRSNVCEMAAVLFDSIRVPLRELPRIEYRESTVVKKLFYKYLEALLVREDQRTNSQNFTPLLSSALFWKSVFACCAVITAVAYSTPNLGYRAILRKLHINIFDFVKITDSFVWARFDLPEELMKHLVAVDEEITESGAWEAGSSIYKHIKLAYQFVQNLELQGDEEPGTAQSKRIFTLLDSPPPKVGMSLRCAAAAPVGNALKNFFRKVLKLGTMRLLEIQELLPFTDTPVVTQKVTSAMEFALYERTHLFYCRHVDQILLCAVYGVCRCHRINILFKELLSCYTKFLRGSKEVIKTVGLKHSDRMPLTEGHNSKVGKAQETVDIIGFYNRVFVPAMCDFLLKERARGKEEQKEKPKTTIPADSRVKEDAATSDCPPTHEVVTTSPPKPNSVKTQRRAGQLPHRAQVDGSKEAAVPETCQDHRDQEPCGPAPQVPGSQDSHPTEEPQDSGNNVQAQNGVVNAEHSAPIIETAVADGDVHVPSSQESRNS